MSEAYIVAAARTAGGRKGGRLSGWHPSDLAGQVLNSLVDRVGCDPALVEDVILGCVGQVGEQGNNIARNAVLSSKLPESVPATSVDRQCGSSQQSIHFAAATVMSGQMDIVIAAGVESMSRVPMGTSVVLPFKAGLGHPKSPAQEARYPGIQFSQFAGAEMIAKKWGFTRENLDDFGFESQQRAIAATRSGAFKDEIVAIEITLADGAKELHTIDEGIRFEGTREGMAGVKLISEGGGLTNVTIIERL